MSAIYRSPAVFVGAAFALLMAATGLFAPLLTTHDPYAVNSDAIFCPPFSCASDGKSHPLGTDHLGRDVLGRIVASFRTSLYIGLLGTFLGIPAAWLLVMSRGIGRAGLAPEMPRPLFGVPLYGLAILTYWIGIFLSIVVTAAAGVSLWAATVCAGAFSAMLPMTLVYDTVRGDLVSSSRGRLAVRRGIELTPMGFSLALLMGLFIESSLSFLGVGVPPPAPSLGGMISGARAHFTLGTWQWVFPLGIVLAAVWAFLAIAIPAGRILVSPAAAALPGRIGTPAGFWIRSVAEMIDLLALITALFVINVLPFPCAIVVIASLVALVWILAASPGKRVLGLHVIRADGSRVGPGRKLFRSLLAWIFSAVLVNSMIAFREDKRGFHDLIFDTVVVQGRRSASVDPPARRP